MTERTISATEARVHFGEVLDSVVEKLDVVYVQRGGRLQAVILSIEEWNRLKQHKSDPWEGLWEKMEEHWAYMAEARKAGRLKDFDSVEEIRAAREERDEQLLGNLLGR